jgi:hypothetical protein
MDTDKKKLTIIRVHLCSSVANNIFASTSRGEIDVAQTLVSAAPRLISARRVEMSLDPAGKSACATSLGA